MFERIATLESASKDYRLADVRSGYTSDAKDLMDKMRTMQN